MTATLDTQTGRARVLGAAAELFVAQGYAGTTLRQIAEAAGIKAGSVYHHFDSKEDLFVAVLDDGIVVMIDAFEDAAASLAGDESVSDRLAAHVRAHLSAVFEHGPFTTAHVTAFYSAPEELRERLIVRRNDYEAHWKILVKELLPHLPAKERRLHQLLLFGAMNNAIEWFDPAGTVSLKRLSALITEQFLNGVGADA